MSRELLVLLAVFVLLPLMQRLLGVARQRQAHTPERADRQPQTTPQPAQAPRPAARAVPPLTDTLPQSTSDVTTASGRTSTRDAAGPAPLAVVPRRRTRRHPEVVGLRNRLDLRRAIVLTTILGPCRATTPYDGPERAGRQ